MDPTSALNSLRMYVRQAYDYSDAETLGEPTDTDVLWDLVTGLAEHADALDGWLSMGGALPDPWEAKELL